MKDGVGAIKKPRKSEAFEVGVDGVEPPTLCL